MSKALATFLALLIIGCSGSSERPIVDFSFPLEQRSSAEVVGKVAQIAQQQGYRIETNDPNQMALMNGGEEALSIWLFNGEKHVGNVITVNENGNIRVMLFQSGFSDESQIEDLENRIRQTFE